MPEIIGHRGARSLFPENTIEGFQAALAAGISSFEIDVGLSADGVLVLSHDAGLNGHLARGPDGAWLGGHGPLIRNLTFAELAQYDVGRLQPGTDYAARYPRQRPIDGARIPTLQAVLALDPAARWTIEIKTYANRPWLTFPAARIAEQVAKVADAAGRAGQVVVQSFDWQGPRHLRRLRPDLAYAWLTTRQTRAWRGGQARLPGSVAAEGGGTWSPRHDELTRRAVDAAHRIGLRVVPWTVNDPADQLRLAGWGVDGLITDDPVAAAALLA